MFTLVLCLLGLAISVVDAENETFSNGIRGHVMMEREISLLCLKFCLDLVEITLSTKTVSLS